MTGGDVIDVRGVTLRRGGKTILDGVSWRVRRGEHWALIGANGSGKTTLLKVVTAAMWPTEGEVSVLGERFGHTDIRELRRKVGWVSSHLEEWIAPGEKALDVVLSGIAATLGLPEEHTAGEAARARELLGLLAGEETAESPYGVLSQGEKQKVLIARAMMADPPLVILDEACAGLDLAAREHLLERLEHMSGRAAGTTIVFVTHHIEEIRPFVSHALLLSGGKVFASGAKAQVLSDDVLSRAFGLAVRVERSGGRYWPRIIGAAS